MRKQTISSRSRQRLCEIRGQWIGQEVEGGSFYRYWYDNERKRVVRKSLLTNDLEEAQILHYKIVMGEPDENKYAPDQVLLGAVFKYYMENHGETTRSAQVSERAFYLCKEFLKKVEDKKPLTVSLFSLVRQHMFMKYCVEEHGLSTKSISTYMSQIQAAINYAHHPRIIIDSKGVEREGSMLATPLKIVTGVRQISKITGQPEPKPRSFVPTDVELVAFINAINREWLFRYVITALNTWARPEAILELDMSTQIDFTTGLVDLNQKGRRQTNKIRPLIRLTDNFRGWLLYWGEDRFINRDGVPAEHVAGQDFELPCERAGVPRMTPYTLRHYMATRVRRVAHRVRPTREERAAWLGHVDPEHRTTEEWYESHDPYYLVNAARGTDEIMLQLHMLSPKSLFSPNSLPNTSLSLVKYTVKSTA